MPLIDHSSRASNRLLLGMLAASAVGAALLVTVLVLLDVGGDGDGSVATDLPPGVVAVVDGIEITEAQWAAAVAEARQGIEFLREQVAIDPEQYQGGPDMQATMEARLRVREALTPETIALASALRTWATAAEAYAQGHEPDAAAIAEKVAEQRRISEAVLAGDPPPVETPHGDAVDNPGEPAGIESLEAALDAAGAERYWDEVFPERLRATHASWALFEAEISNRVPDWSERWNEYQHDLARAADVDLHPDIAALADIDAALDFLARQHALPTGLP